MPKIPNIVVWFPRGGSWHHTGELDGRRCDELDIDGWAVKVGDTLAGRYELRQVLAGGRCSLFLAHDRSADRPIAIKVFDGAHVAAGELQRYAARLAAASAVVHPAVIVPGVQVATSESPPFVAGELLQGEDLASLCARLKPIPWTRATAIVQACAEGLATLAAATGAAHRALRPGNVWLAASGQAQVLDFGIAELGAPPVRPRADGTFVEYRAPEQLEGAPGDGRSDVFSLGVLLFEMVTGVHPFSGPSAAAVAIKLLTQPAPVPSLVAPQIELPAPLTAVITRALARRPKDRIPDPSSLARDLAALLPPPPQVDTPSPAQPPASVQEAPRSSALGEPPPTTHSSSQEQGSVPGDMPRPSTSPPNRGPDASMKHPLAPRRREQVNLGAQERTEVLPRSDRLAAEKAEARTEVLPQGAAASDERTAVLPRRDRTQAQQVEAGPEGPPQGAESLATASGERTEVLPRSGDSGVQRAAQHTGVLPRGGEPEAAESDERTTVMARGERPAAVRARVAVPRPRGQPERDDAPTQTFRPLARPPRGAIDDDARPQREPALDGAYTQVVPRTATAAPRPDDATLILQEAEAVSEATGVVSPVDRPHTPEVHGSPPQQRPEETTQAEAPAAPSAAAVERSAASGPQKFLIALNLLVGLLLVAAVLWMWLGG